MNKKTRLIRIIVSIVFFAWLFFMVQWDELIIRIKDIDYTFLLLSIVMMPILIILSALKLKVILSRDKKAANFLFLVRLYLIGYFFSNFFPSTVGGDVVRSYYLGRRIGSQKDSAVTIFIERFSGLLVLLILAAFSSILLPSNYRVPSVLIPSLLSALILCVILLLTIKRPSLSFINAALKMALIRLSRFYAWVTRNPTLVINQKVDKAYRTAVETIDDLRSNLVFAVDKLVADKYRILMLLSLTLLIYLFSFINIYFAFCTFNVHPQIGEIIPVITIVLLINLIPVSHGNLGFTEGVNVYYFSIVGIDPSAALTMALFMRLKLLCSGLIGYVFFLSYAESKKDLSELKRVHPIKAYFDS